MTTPEAFKRRQQIEGGLIIVIGLLMSFQTWWYDRRDDQQDQRWQERNAAVQKCFAKQFKETGDVLEERSDIATAVNKNERDYNLGHITQAQYEAATKRLANMRKNTPYPQWRPAGCE